MRHAGSLASALHRPVPASAMSIAVAITVAVALVHELAHATVLTHFGGRPRSIGVMLMYLAPVPYCDVTDAWSLHRRQRVAVAAAGPVVHLVACALAASTLLVTGSTFVASVVVVVVGFNLALALMNLVPFVAFDGYWMLASALDRPSLRPAGLEAAGATVRRLLFQTTSDEPGPALLLVGYGLLAAIVPLPLLAAGLLELSRVATRTGASGATLWIMLLIAILLRVTNRLRAVASRAWAGRRLVRRWALGIASGVVIAGLVGAAHAGYTPHESIGFRVGSQRPAHLAMIRLDRSSPVIAPGVVARVRSRSVLGSPVVGSVTILRTEGRSVEVSTAIDPRFGRGLPVHARLELPARRTTALGWVARHFVVRFFDQLSS
jgi:putative peptide zinc metalloprotease protein